jgi:hypothetical protein
VNGSVRSANAASSGRGVADGPGRGDVRLCCAAAVGAARAAAVVRTR